MRASFELERFERAVAVPGIARAAGTIEVPRPVDEHNDLRRA